MLFAPLTETTFWFLLYMYSYIVNKKKILPSQCTEAELLLNNGSHLLVHWLSTQLSLNRTGEKKVIVIPNYSTSLVHFLFTIFLSFNQPFLVST